MDCLSVFGSQREESGDVIFPGFVPYALGDLSSKSKC